MLSFQATKVSWEVSPLIQENRDVIQIFLNGIKNKTETVTYLRTSRKKLWENAWCIYCGKQGEPNFQHHWGIKLWRTSNIDLKNAMAHSTWVLQLMGCFLFVTNWGRYPVPLQISLINHWKELIPLRRNTFYKYLHCLQRFKVLVFKANTPIIRRNECFSPERGV